MEKVVIGRSNNLHWPSFGLSVSTNPLPKSKRPQTEIIDIKELVILGDGQVVTESRIVAAKFKKGHFNIAATLRSFADKGLEGITEKSFKTNGNQLFTRYEMTREAFLCLSSGFMKGRDVYQTHSEFIAAFDEMEAKLKPTQPEIVEDPKPMSEFIEPEIVEESEPALIGIKDLVVMGDNGQLITDSKAVASFYGKQHQHVMRDIRKLIGRGESNFGLVEIIDKNASGGPVNKSYYTMDRDGFTMLAMGFTGDKAHKFKKAYIEAFNAMEKELSKSAAPATQLEVLVGVAKGLLEQDRKLKEIEGEFVEADERNRATAEKVAELDHVFRTNGCAKGFIPFTDVRMTYGKSVWEGIDVQSHRQEARNRLRSHGRGDHRGTARDTRHQRPGRHGRQGPANYRFIEGRSEVWEGAL